MDRPLGDGDRASLPVLIPNASVEPVDEWRIGVVDALDRFAEIADAEGERA
jgi:hypothetical protein